MHNERSKIIGDRIHTLLLAHHQRQKDLAQVLGVTDNTISYFINGKRTPNIEQLSQIADHFDTTVDYLLGRTDTKANDSTLQAVCAYTELSEEAVNALLNEWAIDGLPLIAKYEDEPEKVKAIENQLLAQNMLFEVAHKIFGLSDLYTVALQKLNKEPDNWEKADMIADCKRNVNGSLFELSKYIVDTAEQFTQSEREKLKNIDQEVRRRLME